MSYQVNEKEIVSVSKLSAPDRYSYFVRKVADWDEVWSVGEGESWKLLASDSGEFLVPVWPAHAFALVCCTGDWSSCTPRSIPLVSWMEKWIPGMVRDARRAAVFPLPNSLAMPVEPERLANDIQDELDCLI